METRIAAVAAAPDPGQVQPSVRTAPGGQAPVPTGPDPADMRLVIEEDQASGSYVYKTVNRRTGEVVLQLPRAEVLKLRQELQYTAGAVIRTKA
ncbi:flagellar protein FlaG [Phenylobacterium sp.]|uniref:flagellar protein FlaG n=1 Tax=Phenylobacterium sp. TaxID=1871053 RepID=UPI0025D26ABD|nr:flagellar protein FlaG [Phenylobacterium sp.]